MSNPSCAETVNSSLASILILCERSGCGAVITSCTARSQATEGQQSLDQQGGSLGGTLGGLEQMASQLPGVSRLLRAIHNRRQRDGLIVAVVVGLCVCTFLYLLFRKLGI